MDWRHLRSAIDTPAASAPSPRARGKAWRWLLVVISVAALLLGLVALREPLTRWLWPDTRQQHLLQQAEAALRAGRLDGADGQGARQLFEAAQALDNDRPEARAGLARVAEAALTRATVAMEAGDLARSRHYLQLARELQIPRQPAERLEQALRRREAAQAGIDDLLRQARQAQAEGRIDGGEQAALPLYQRVLALQPTRVEALEGREDALSDLSQRANDALERGRLAAAAALLARIRHYDAGHIELPPLQARLTELVDRRLAQADRALARGRGDDAAAGYQAVLEAEPAHEAARRGQERVAAAWAAQAAQRAADFDFDGAARWLDKARSLSPRSPAIDDAQRRIAAARQLHARTAAPLPAAERERRVATALAAMQQAGERGQWLAPPGESAFDHLRRAQALAPDDAQVRQAAQRLLPTLRQCFEDELHGNRLRRAQSCLQAWQTLQPGHAELADARRRMAQKWIAVGDERLGAGDVAFAAQALQEAQRLDRQAPGVEDFAGRVRSAQPGVN